MKPANAQNSGPLNNRNALFIYVLLFFALIYPFWLSGELIVPYRLTSEIGAPPALIPPRMENSGFTDFWDSTIPSIRDHLTRRRSSWITLWIDSTALGRAPWHTMGLSPAYAPIWLLSKITSSPFLIVTLLSLGTCFLAGLFVLLLCRELSLEPIAGLLAGGSVAASPLMMYWLAFPMFLAVICWSAGCLYALARLARRTDLTGCLVLAFSSHSLLMMGYPQAVIQHAYVLAGYMIWHVYRIWRSMGIASAARYFGVVVVTGAAGAVLAMPVYLDLAKISVESARVSPDISFFLSVVFKIDSVTSAFRFLAVGLFPEIIGHPISPSYPLVYSGLSITALVLFFAFYSAFGCWRQTWGWWLAIALLCAFALISPLYAFGVRYLGFHLSRSTPLGAMTLPMTMIFAIGVNELIRRSPFKPTAARLAVFSTLACLGVVLCFYRSAGLGIRWNIIFVTLFVVFLVSIWDSRFQTLSLVAALIVTGSYVSFPLMLWQPQENLIPTSTLIDKIKAATAQDSRFAIAAPGLRELPPNINEVYDVASIHSYDSLSSRRYQALIGKLGGKFETYGRLNTTILPDYGSQAFWMSNISLVLSPAPLNHPNLEHIGQEGAVQFYRVVNRMGCCLQTTLPEPTASGAVELPDQKETSTRRPLKTKDEGDLLEIEVYDRKPSLLMLSQQYDSNWQAETLSASGWVPARTTSVNGIFQGVILPADTQVVRLRYLPFVRFAWINVPLWAFVLVLLALKLSQAFIVRGFFRTGCQ